MSPSCYRMMSQTSRFPKNSAKKFVIPCHISRKNRSKTAEKLVGKKLHENFYGRKSLLFFIENYHNDAAIYGKILEHKPCQQFATLRLWPAVTVLWLR